MGIVLKHTYIASEQYSSENWPWWVNWTERGDGRGGSAERKTGERFSRSKSRCFRYVVVVFATRHLGMETIPLFGQSFNVVSDFSFMIMIVGSSGGDGCGGEDDSCLWSTVVLLVRDLVCGCANRRRTIRKVVIRQCTRLMQSPVRPGLVQVGQRNCSNHNLESKE